MSSKITIIGAGSVGSTIAYTLSSQDIASEIVLIDINKQKAKFSISFREPVSEILFPSLPVNMKMPKTLILLSLLPVLPVSQVRQDLNLHRQM